MDWSSGELNAKANHFEAEVYRPIYETHLANLQKMEDKAPTAFAKLCIDFWTNAS
jgi:hypothetical protein